MRKNRIRRVVIHAPESMQALPSKVNTFYIEVLVRRLNQSTLTTAEKAAIIDCIIAAMLSREA